MDNPKPMPAMQVATEIRMERQEFFPPTLVPLRPPELRVLQFLGRVRLATLAQLAALVLHEYERRGPRGNGSYSPSYRLHDPLARSLTKLVRAGYIDRLDCGVHYLVRRPDGRFTGAAQAVYALSGAGVRYLAGLDQAPPAERRWRKNNREIGPLQVLHSVAVTDVCCAFSLAFLERRDYELAEWLQGSEELKTVWYAKHREEQQGARRCVIPDAAFAIRHPQSGKAKNSFLELDQGTATVKRFADKIRSYVAWYHAGCPGWDVEHITVLTVCRSMARAEHLRQAARAVVAEDTPPGTKTPAGLFRFTTHEHWSLENPVPILEARIWRTLDDELTLDLLH